MDQNELKSLLSRFRIRPNKLLGQNFLLSESVLDQIVAAANLNKDDTVLEIGPGLGVLTKRLAEKAGPVVAVEKDKKLAKALQKMMASYKNVEIVEGDALRISDSNLRMHANVANSRHSNGDSRHSSRYKVVANIPYYLTGQVLQKFLSNSNLRIHPNAPNRVYSEPSDEDSHHSDRYTQPRPTLVVLLLQKEVAERIVAEPGQMSILSVSVQFYADPEIIAYVPKENFYPVPEVDSAIVRLKVLPQPRFKLDEKNFFRLVKIGFSSKRKQLQNNLRGIKELRGEKGEIKGLLFSLGFDPKIRAQDLSLEDWRRLYEKIYK